MKQDINRHEILEKITPLIENTAMRFGYIPIEIEFIKENHRWFLRIYLYSKEKEVTLDDCEKVTRSVSDFLDELIPIIWKFLLLVWKGNLNQTKSLLFLKAAESALSLKLRLRGKMKRFLKAKFWILMRMKV